MKEEIYYKDLYLRPITEQQAQLSDYCHKYYKIENTVKRRDTFEDGKLLYIKYYIELTENLEDVLAELSPLNPAAEQIIIVDRQIHGVYTAGYCEVYRPTGELFIETKELYDDKGRCLCSINVTNQHYAPDESHVRKYYYDETLYGGWGFEENPKFLVFDAYYNPNGSLNYINFNPRSDQDRMTFRSDNYDELVSICGLSPELEDYYFTDKFLPDLPV